MLAIPHTRSEPALSDTALYALCQAIGWTAVAGVITYFGAISVETGVYAVSIAGTGLAASHGLRSLVRRRGWFARPLAFWMPRLAAATVVVGLAWWFVIDVGQNVAENGQSLGEAVRGTIRGDLFGLNRVTALLHVVLLALWSALYVAGNALRRYREAELVAWQREAQVREAELRALHAQLNPHFLFNALNSLRALIAGQPAQAQDATTRLARLLRYTLRTSQVETVPLPSELEAVRDYLALETLRFEDRLQVEWRVEPDAEQFRVPPLVLLTLVENAVKHGVASRAEGGVVAVGAVVEGGALHLRVENPGTITPATGDEAHGLRNVRERLRLLYGERALLRLDEGGAKVNADVYLPARLLP